MKRVICHKGRANVSASGGREFPRLLQLRELRPGFLQYGDVGSGIFPESEEILIGGLGLGGVTREHICAGEAEMRQRAKREVDNDAAVVEELLKLGDCSGAVVCHQLSLASDVGGIHCA